MSHVNESCHIWRSHVTHEWVMSHMNETCHTYMEVMTEVGTISHVTCKWVTSHMNESCHIWMSHVTYEWVRSHMNESCHIWMSHVTYERVMSHMNHTAYILKPASFRRYPRTTYVSALQLRCSRACSVFCLLMYLGDWMFEWVSVTEKERQPYHAEGMCERESKRDCVCVDIYWQTVCLCATVVCVCAAVVCVRVNNVWVRVSGFSWGRETERERTRVCVSNHGQSVRLGVAAVRADAMHLCVCGGE